MPEGPSIVILAEAVREFEGRRIIGVSGNTKEDLTGVEGQEIFEFRTWGKHFLICLHPLTIRIHFMLFGTYRINEQKPSPPRLSLLMENGELNFYACSVKVIGNPNKIYDWSADVMNDAWSPRKAMTKLRNVPNMLICDALLEQDIFSGVGNIIKNEVLYRVHVHPEAKVGDIPVSKLRDIVKQSRIYSFEFLEWKKEFTLKKHWLAHTKRKCRRCDLPLIKKHTGVKKRRSFFCTKCQKQYL